MIILFMQWELWEEATRESSRKSNLMVQITKESWFTITVHKLLFPQLAEFCFVELMTKTTIQEL